MILAVSVATVFISVFGIVFLAFSQRLPDVYPQKTGDSIFVSDALPQNCNILGVSVSADDHIYLHARNQTLYFDKSGEYLGRFVYNANGKTFCKVTKSSGRIWVSCFRTGIKYRCDPDGVVLRKEKLIKNDYADNQYPQSDTDANGNVYRVKRFLCFSRVTGPDASTFYNQSVLFILCGIFVFAGAFSAIICIIIKLKNKPKKRSSPKNEQAPEKTVPREIASGNPYLQSREYEKGQAAVRTGNKKRTAAVIVVAVLLCVSIIGGTFASFVYYAATHPYQKIFNDFSELEAFGPYETRELKEKTYVDNDKIVNRYTKELKWKGIRFRVYCYIFSDEETTRLYLQKKHGYNNRTFHESFGLSSNGITTCYFVFSGTRCMTINGGPIFVFYPFLDWFTQSFSEYID